MGRMKDWMMDMDWYIEEALLNNVTDPAVVKAYVRQELPFVDEDYVEKKMEEILGE